MRIPINKIYRAFPELDHLSDEQCKLLMRRIELRFGTNFWASIAIGIVWFIFFVISIFIIAICTSLLDNLGVNIYRYEYLMIALALLILLGLPSAVAALVRDTIFRTRLIRAIDYEVDRVRCLKCKYILIGQIADDDHITCPECGERHRLARLGITEADLIPPAA